MHDHHFHDHHHDHCHSHEHEHTHEHTHDGHTHSHAHHHEHTHSHEHPHTHDHLHEHGHEHHHSHAPMDELLALMKYMTGHNAAHAKELAELAYKLDEVGSHMAYHKVMDAVACFEQGNGMLSEVLHDLGME